MFWTVLGLVSAQGTPAAVQAKITALTLSRAGLAEITREIPVQPGFREYVLRDVPMAIDGTFWFEGLDGAEVAEARTRLAFKDNVEKVRLVAIGDILANNLGKKVRLKTAPFNQKPETVEAAVRYVAPPSVGLATLEQANGSLRMVRVSDIQELEAKGLDMVASVHESMPELSLRLRVRASKPGRVAVRSIEPGLAWTPSYRITIEDEQNATVLAKYQVASSVHKLKDARLTLIASEVSLPKARVGDLSAGAGELVELEDEHLRELVELVAPQIGGTFYASTTIVYKYKNYSSGIGYKQTTGYCVNTYCHGAGLSSPQWGLGNIVCGEYCHETPPATGRHVKHFHPGQYYINFGPAASPAVSGYTNDDGTGWSGSVTNMDRGTNPNSNPKGNRDQRYATYISSANATKTFTLPDGSWYVSACVGDSGALVGNQKVTMTGDLKVEKVTALGKNIAYAVASARCLTGTSCSRLMRRLPQGISMATPIIVISRYTCRNAAIVNSRRIKS